MLKNQEQKIYFINLEKVNKEIIKKIKKEINKKDYLIQKWNEMTLVMEECGQMVKHSINQIKI